MRLTQRELDSDPTPGIALAVDADFRVASGEHIEEVQAWARENCRGRVFRDIIVRSGFTMAYKFRFDHDADKVLFKLRWA